MAFLFNDDKSRVDLNRAIAPILAPLESAYQTNIDSVYTTLVNSGSTPADKSPSSINSAIDNIVTQIYQLLQSLGQTPASKKLADLKTAITGLTTKTWTDTFPMGAPDRLDCANIQSMTVTNGSQPMPLLITYYDKTGNHISVETIQTTASATFPSNARYADFGGSVSAITVVYQTKMLRGN